MGLRLHTNVSAVTSLRHLNISDRLQKSSLKRLSSGDAIAEDSNDPSGLVISEKLRAQIGSLQQARENSEHASHLISTADEALGEICDLLTTIRGSLVFALNTGGASEDQLRAEQDAVDNAILSIDRIAASTRFGKSNLLNGSSAIRVTDKSPAISDLSVRSVAMNRADERTFEIDIAAAAERAAIVAQLDTATGTAAGDQIIRITGAIGSKDVLVNDGVTTQDMMEAINAVRENTGVYATLASGTLGSPAAGDAILLQSDEYGADQEAMMDVIQGDSLYAAPEADGTPEHLAVGDTVRDTGADLQAGMRGMKLSARGNDVIIKNDQLNARITLADGTGPADGPVQFTVADSGFTFQLHIGTAERDSVTVGLDGVASAFLGMAERTRGGTGTGTSYEAVAIGGYVSSIRSGGANDLATNPGNGVRIVDAAINDISEYRSFLGSFQSSTIESNMNSLNIAFQNLAASESDVRDLDYARESAEFARRRINVEAGTSVLASANLISQNVLSLLA